MPGVAFLFPGQGSQAPGMLAALARADRRVEQTFAEASALLGYDLWALVQEGPAERLDRTEHTQPAMLVADVAVWRVLAARASRPPAAVAGHSLGEYAALVCAGALEFTDAVRLVAARGRYMQEAVPAGVGAVAAVLGLDDERVAEACAAAAEGEVVSAANYNAPGQVVIAGHESAVERATERLREAGARRVVRLPLSVPVHCELMRPAAERLAERLAEIAFSTPSVAVVHNVDAGTHPDPDEMRAALAAQAWRPVRWVDTVRTCRALGADAFLELGPGQVLSGLVRRIAREATVLAVHDEPGLEQALALLEEAA